MKFELNPDNRNSSNEDLLNDVIAVAKKLGKKSITRKEYDQNGRFSEGTLRKRFGGWINVLENAGLTPTRDYEITNDELIAELQRISMLPNIEYVTREIFNKYKKISNTNKIEKTFGSWSNALKKAGLQISSKQIAEYTEEELFENLFKVWTHKGKQPTITNMYDFPSEISGNTYTRKYKSWRNTLESFIAYANNENLSNHKKIKTEAVEQSMNLKTKEKSVTHKTSRNINLRLRFLIMKQDNFKCRFCGNSPAKNPLILLHIDHIIPWSKGGETVIENLQTLCSNCNLGKSDIE